MSGIPLTEERFLALLESQLKPIKEELSKVQTDISGLKTQMIELTNFQKLEAKTIEYELRQILKKHIEKHYPLMRINTFSMKEIKDPVTEKIITELDGAFTLQQWSPAETNVRRLAEAGLPRMQTLDHVSPTIFILAEAKHKIDDKKIAEKLGQFDAIVSFFNAAMDCRLGTTCPSTKFAKMVARNKDIAYMEQYILFFGASFWEESLMDDLERDLADRKVMVAKFFELSADRKIGIYRKIREVEKRWYAHKDFPEQLPPDYDLSDSQILTLKEIKGAMNHIQFVLPSGERYRVYEDVSEIKPLATVPVLGGYRTRRERLITVPKTP